MENERRLSRLEEQIKTLFNADKVLCNSLEKNESDIKAIQKDLHVQTEMLVEIRHLREEQEDLKNIINARLIDLPHNNYNSIKNYIAISILSGIIGYVVNIVFK